MNWVGVFGLPANTLKDIETSAAEPIVSEPGWLATNVQVPDVINVIERSVVVQTDGVLDLKIGVKEYSDEDKSILYSK